MIGSGSVGLIVCYQLMQAGAEIVGIVEALPQINGYAVHASKLAREGVPIYTGYTITQALGDDPCNRRCDCKGKPGLVHSAGERDHTGHGHDRLRRGAQAPDRHGATWPAASWCSTRRWAAGRRAHNRHMESTVPGIYVAGDTTAWRRPAPPSKRGRSAALRRRRVWAIWMPGRRRNGLTRPGGAWDACGRGIKARTA